MNHLYNSLGLFTHESVACIPLIQNPDSCDLNCKEEKEKRRTRLIIFMDTITFINHEESWIGHRP